MSACFKLNHMVYFCSGLTEILVLCLPQKFERFKVLFQSKASCASKGIESIYVFE